MAIDTDFSDVDTSARDRSGSTGSRGGFFGKAKGFFRKLKYVAVVLGVPLAGIGTAETWEQSQKGQPHKDISEAAGVETLNTCTITSADGVEVMMGATIDPKTGDAKVFTYNRPDSSNELEATYSIDTVQVSTDDNGNEVANEVKGDVIGLNRGKEIQETQLYARNGAKIQSVTGNVLLVKRNGEGRTIEGACQTAVAISRSLGD